MPTRRQLANAIRALSMDAVQKANSGHPGMPMGMADIAQVLWTDHLKHNPGNPEWADRDRFVLSNGHGSMLLYSLLHLTGYPLAIDDLTQLPAVRLAHGGPPGGRPAPRHRDDDRPARPGPRQCRRHGARREAARGHVQPARARDRRPPHLRVPRRRLPDGRRFARSLLAGRHAQARQARSCFYDDNGISIDGEVHGWFTDDTPKRFEAYGWHVVPNVDGHDAAAIEARHPGGESGSASVADLLQDHHRLGFAEQAGHRSHARRAARRRRGRRDARSNSAGPPRRSSCRTTSVRAGTPGRRAPRSSRPGSSGSRPIAQPIRSSRPNSSVAARRPAGRLAREVAGVRRCPDREAGGDRHALRRRSRC